jgi:hypothetical protein
MQKKLFFTRPRSIWKSAGYGVANRAFFATCFTLFFALVTNSGCQKRVTVKAMSADQIEVRVEKDGNVYFLADNGNVYREIVPNDQWELIETVFSPNDFTDSYVTKKDTTYRIAPDTHEQFEVIRDFKESFENLNSGTSGLAQLVHQDRLRWGSFTLQSPKAPNVQAYVDLRNKILQSQSGFLDCIVEPTSERAHSGGMSLKCVTPAKPGNMVTCKASLSTPLVYYRNGENVWYEAYYWVEDNYPLTLIDLECEFVKEHPGIRIRFYGDGYLGAELKALSKPQFHQPVENQVKFPTKQWVCVRVHFLLSPTDGKIEIWQNGKLILSADGPTLPFRSAIYNSLEVGISAHSDPSQGATMYMDDIRMSTSEF